MRDFLRFVTAVITIAVSIVFGIQVLDFVHNLKLRMRDATQAETALRDRIAVPPEE